MIKVNLLPEEFRIVHKSPNQFPVMRVSILVGIFFMILTVFFYFDYLHASKELKTLTATWTTLQPQSAQLKALETEVESTLKPERDFLLRHVMTAKPLTFGMSWVNELLPESGWLTELRMEQGQGTQSLFIKGLVLPSKERSSIELIEVFLHQLKERIPEAELSLTTTRQKIEGAEVTQFTANFDWKVS